MKRLSFFLSLLAGLLGASALFGCSKTERPGTGNSPPAAAAVQWPELKALEVLAEKSDAVAVEKNAAVIRPFAAEAAKALNALAASPIPANARNPLTVKERLADVRELAQALAKPDASPDDLAAPLLALHELAATLMAEAGMPHVHDH